MSSKYNRQKVTSRMIFQLLSKNHNVSDVNVWKRICARVCLTLISAAVEVGLAVAIVVVSVSVGIGSGFDTISGPGVGLALVRVPIVVVLVFGPRDLLVESLVASEESWIFKYDWQVSFNFSRDPPCTVLRYFTTRGK